MGREAMCECRWAADQGRVKALLESGEIVVRGEIRRRVAFPAIAGLHVSDGELRFSVAADAVSLALGAAEAARWERKILAPPPSLAGKLGVGPGSKAYVIGPVPVAELAAALEGAQAAVPDGAALAVAVVATAQELEQAVRIHAGLVPRLPIWVIHGKAGVGVSEAAARQAMRQAGLIDTKVAAVAPGWSATRYSVRSAAG